MKLRIITNVLLLCLSCLTLGGCWDSKELEGQYYIHSIGVDYVDEKYVVYGQIINFAGGGEDGDSGGTIGNQHENVSIAKGTGESVVAAIHNLYVSTQRRIYWGHLSSVVFHERVMGEAFKNVLDDFSRYYEIRPTLWMFITSDPVNEILGTFPVMQTSILYSFLGEPGESYEQSSRVQPIRKSRFEAELYEPGRTVSLPSVNIVRKKWYDPLDYGNNLSLNKAGFLTKDSYKGSLAGADINGLVYIDDEAGRNATILRKNDRPVVTEIVTDPKLKVVPEITGDSVAFSIELAVTATVIEITEEVDEQFLIENTEKVVEGHIRRTFEKGVEIGADIYNLSHSLYRKDPEKWREFTNEAGELELTKDLLTEINVEATIIHSGAEKLHLNKK
ncbi:Ger(x)C family spore germination protein [Alteribacter keqinensis]|uniref:Ger(X)C family spore germination protein n=1 Tax=Alteribacter keqinensis TaxID=2483800 RepID=A0A3M7TQM5_9BACI|nr:Ger(x)C family spore germination protein [Alteribacter keqinensis]RNA67946.1 Ger(x)C family spore germination protein [Alteribacter keqinensis]